MTYSGRTAAPNRSDATAATCRRCSSNVPGPASVAEVTVGQRVHRVDDDGPDTLAGAAAEDVVDDGGDVGQALARAGAGGEDVVVAPAGRADGLLLVPVEAQRPPAVGAAPGRLLL